VIDIRTEIRGAFEREQSEFPPPAALRAQVVAAVTSRARAAAPARQRADWNLNWLMVAAAILLTIAIIAGLVAVRLMNSHPILVKPGPAPQSASWTATGNMVTARSGHTATLLPDGKVLVAGGVGINFVVLASAELYDPSTGRWTATGNMITSRASHTAALLPNGKVLVAGGELGNRVLASAELYDPSTGRWSATGNMVTSRAHHTTTLLPDGKVLVAGGVGGNRVLASAELYDPSTRAWTATGNMVTPRSFHTAALLPDGKVLVAGGELGNRVLASAELYDPSTGRWSATRNMVTPRFGHTATLLPDGKVLVAGGAGTSAELYDPSTGRWTATGNMIVATASRPATLLLDGTVLVVSDAGTASLYHPDTGSWTAPGTTVNRYDATATLLPDGTVLVAGGWGPREGQALASAELYHPVATPSPAPLVAPSGALVGPSGSAVVPGTLLDPGTYTYLDVDGAGFNVRFTVPAGWTWNGRYLSMGGVGVPNGAGIFFDGNLVQVYTNPCHWAGADPIPPTGSSVHDLMAALAAQPMRNATTPTVRNANVPDFSGGNAKVLIGRWLGMAVELTVPNNIVLANCSRGQFRSWGPDADARSHEGAGQRDLVWAVDLNGNGVGVGGERLIIDAASFPGTPANVMSEIEAILGSIAVGHWG
jgi:hypothetical protein